MSIYSEVKLLPKVFKTNPNVSKLDVPGKRGFPDSNSGTIHPSAQISTDLL